MEEICEIDESIYFFFVLIESYDWIETLQFLRVKMVGVDLGVV